MNYKRSRVAITINDTGSKMIHVGHARTLLLGSLISEEEGCPFQIRLDGIRRQYNTDTTFPVIDLVNCLSFLGIEYDKMYWISMRFPDLSRMVGELGEEGVENVRRALMEPGVSPSEFPGILSDDSLLNHPSLIIRGMEFRIPELYGGTNPTSGNMYVATEDMIYRAAGRDKYEINTPLIVTDDGNKISKQSSILMHWECLEPLGRDTARRFLLATATSPLRPFDSYGLPFSISMMSEMSYIWDWNDYAKAIRRDNI